MLINNYTAYHHYGGVYSRFALEFDSSGLVSISPALDPTPDLVMEHSHMSQTHDVFIVGHYGEDGMCEIPVASCSASANIVLGNTVLNHLIISMVRHHREVMSTYFPDRDAIDSYIREHFSVPDQLAPPVFITIEEED